MRDFKGEKINRYNSIKGKFRVLYENNHYANGKKREYIKIFIVSSYKIELLFNMPMYNFNKKVKGDFNLLICFVINKKSNMQYFTRRIFLAIIDEIKKNNIISIALY